ncbi:MAG: DNA repair protein RadA [Candidatus Gracilibacteria bacterium]|nr:DNA repair protein RadA [Candidatus Gracilibacteria bacterium]
MYICNNCGNEYVKWQGQCSFCKEWNTLVEFKESKIKEKAKAVKKELEKLSGGTFSEDRIITKSEELNNVLGGGIVPGSLVLLSGEPGIGKSTLSLQLASFIDKQIIYVSGEETIGQLTSRANRLSIKGDNLSILCENNIENILETIKGNLPDLLIIDSISVLSSGEVSGGSGSISQVKYIAEKLQDFAKKNNITTVIIGHVTKDGNLAGPKILEHLVDTVLFFEGERFEDIRILRSIKNRFGNSSEIAIFKMGEEGLKDLKNPGLELIDNKEKEPIVGSSLSITIEGNRPILIECEALTNYTKFGYPKRSVRGINVSKLDMLAAILSKYTKIKLDSSDVYLNIARGLKIEDPAIDLGLVSAMISSKTNKAIDRESIFIGEISLTGTIKNIIQLEKRIKEAEKLGFKRVFVPNIEIKGDFKIEVIKVKSISDFVEKVG